ncbi:MAG: hypothetical protein CMN55_01205 [Sneathiella sp.]|uniref:acyl-CoA dehydrogenase family protein n=1 Tax=Sneathiella sp. TaxID=1964365 RepID=UPI000C554DEA|nr:acyl-CoA dehydrogenase family protein [Sneathiella sp.]MAL77726.1 hypothetical protein [Sneathiella sp.]
MNPQFADPSGALNAVAAFARDQIAPRREELISSPDFPADIWNAFAGSGLAALSAPAEFGGLDADYRTLSQAAQILNRYGGVPGMTMTFMAHWLTVKLHIAGDAPDGLKQRLLPELASGDKTIAVAISEPGAGAHPKHLKTTARRDGDEFVVTGEKTYLTNGPIADYFVTLAITGETNGQKKFSALLIPAATEGFEKTAGVKIDFLHPCPHGGIRMQNCRIPATHMIGEEGEAFNRTSLRMRAIEDAAGAGGLVGSMVAVLTDIATVANDEQAGEIGAIATQLQGLSVIAAHLAAMADAAKEDVQPLLELHLGFHQQCRMAATALEALLQATPAADKPETALLCRDIVKTLGIAKGTHAARHAKSGRAILAAARS